MNLVFAYQQQFAPLQLRCGGHLGPRRFSGEPYGRARGPLPLASPSSAV